MKYRKYFLIFISLAVFTLLTSCSPWVVINQSTNDRWINLDSESTVGQTFVADYSGLQAVYFLLSPQSSGEGTLVLHLRGGPESSTDFINVKLPIKSISSSKSYRFDFPRISKSDNQYYYAFLSVEGEGSVRVGIGPADTYQEGAAYQNHKPEEAQLTFSLDYDRSDLTVGVIKQIIQFALLSIIGTLIFTIPGWAVLNLFWKGWNELSWFEKLPIGIGVSMAFYTLIVLFEFLLNIKLGMWYVWIPVLVGTVFMVWRSRYVLLALKSRRNLLNSEFISVVRNSSSFWPNVSLIVILGLILITRFWAMHGLNGPMWNDSLHHTEISQLIFDNRGLFTSWLPYTPYQTFSMHFGFPLMASILSWITGMSSPQAVLYTGQIINIFAALALYPITVKLTHGNRMGGVIAVLAAGLLSPMPAFYINWGRYAQLAGQVVFPIAMWMMWEVLDWQLVTSTHSKRATLPWAKITITASVIAGMILFEYRMIFVITSFVIALCIGELIKHARRNTRILFLELWSILIIGLLTIVLFFPWSVRLQQSNLINYTDFNREIDSLINLVKQDYKTWLNIDFYLPTRLLILGCIAWLWAIIKKNWSIVSLGIWVILMASLYLLIILQIPWIQYVQSFAVVISLYIPVSILAGYLVAEVINRYFHWKPTVIAVSFTVFILGILGAWNQRNISDPGIFAFVTRPDIRAMVWIQDHIPPDSLFLIEGMHENWVTNVIGTDAGWWIPVLAHRGNTIPPQYALANEIPIAEGYSQKVVDLEATLEKDGVVSEAGIKKLCDYGISHVFIGQKQGTVGNVGKPLFTHDELASSQIFHLIYQQDRVYIYSVEGVCGQ